MDRTLKKLFDFQHFRQKDRLTAVIGDVESRYASALSDDEAELVSAAGTACVPTEQADALLMLKERERDLIVLHDYKGHTLKTVAEMMGMSYINAKAGAGYSRNGTERCVCGFAGYGYDT